MITVFHAWLYGRFIETQSNLRRKYLHRTNQGSNYFGGTFSNRDNAKAKIQFTRQSQPSILTAKGNPLDQTSQRKPVEFFKH